MEKDTLTACEKVDALDLPNMSTDDVAKVLLELDQAIDRVSIRAKDYATAAEKLRAEMMRRMNEQGAKSINITGVGLFTIKKTDRFSSKSWIETYEWLWQQAKRIEAEAEKTGQGDPKTVFSWLGKSVSAEQCKTLLADDGQLPSGVEKSTQVTLSFTRKDK